MFSDFPVTTLQQANAKETITNGDYPKFLSVWMHATNNTSAINRVYIIIINNNNKNLFRVFGKSPVGFKHKIT